MESSRMFPGPALAGLGTADSHHPRYGSTKITTVELNPVSRIRFTKYIIRLRFTVAS